MKLGVNLINFGPAAGPDTFRQWVRVVEGLGYHSIMIHRTILRSRRTWRRNIQRLSTSRSRPWDAAGFNREDRDRDRADDRALPEPIETARSLTNIEAPRSGRPIFGVGILGGGRVRFALKLPFRPWAR